MASMAYAQNPYPYPLYGVPDCGTGSLSASTSLSWYFTYCPGASGCGLCFTPGALNYGYAETFSPYGFGNWYGEGCAPASPKAAYPKDHGKAPQWVYPAPMPPQVTYPTPAPPQIVYPTPEPLPQLVYPTATPVPPQPSGVQTCSSAEPCPPPPQYENMAWGTFGTFANWAHKFRQEHCCCPTDTDVADFWASQAYLEQTGQTPFSGGFCWQ